MRMARSRNSNAGYTEPMLRLVCLFAFAVGCSKDGPDTAETAPITGPTHTIWSGWNHTWDMLSHRVSVIDVRPGPSGEATSGILGGDWSTGDTWSDDVNHRVHQQHVTGSELRAEAGSITLLVPPGGVTTTVPVELEDAQTVVINGFTINTDTKQIADYPSDYDPALGYTSRGFAIGAHLTEGGDVELTVDVRWGPRDRDPMNRALAVAQTDVTVDYMVLAASTAIQTATFSAAQDLQHDPPYSDQSGITQALSWSGYGVAGITSFALFLDETDGGDGGDYLRSFGVEMAPMPEGAPPEHVAGEILTSSALELATMSMSAEAGLVWVPLDPSESHIEGETIAGTHPVGTFTVPIGSET